MSTATEISRLTSARNTIRDKMIDLGLAASTDKLDVLATAVDSIANRGAVSATVQEGDTYTIPAGYHNGSGTVSGVAGGGNYSLQSKVIAPTKAQQSVTPDSGFYGLSDVTVSAIPEAYQNVSAVNATADDVLGGKIIVNAAGESVTGTMPNNGAVTRTLDATSNNQTYTIPKGYHNGNGKVQINLEVQTIEPTKAPQTITPTSGNVLGAVEIAAIPDQYQDTTNVDASAGDVLEGKTIVTADGEVAGTMVDNGTVNQVLDTSAGNQTYTIPAGKHSGSGKVSISLESKSVTPATTGQTVAPSTGKVLSEVVVDPIPSNFANTEGDDAVAANLLDGKVAHSYNETTGKAVEIVGTMQNNGAVSKTLDATANNQTYTVPIGYHNGSGTVNIVLEQKSATPTKGAQTITPTAGKVLSRVTVNAIPDDYQDVTAVTAAAGDVLEGKKIVIADGSVVNGTMADNGTVTQTLDATTGNQSFTIAAGKHSGAGKVSIVLEQKTATPNTTTQSITPTAGKVLSKVTVNPIPTNWGNTTGDTATAAQVLAGYKAHSISDGSAVAITGTMPNNGAIMGSFDGLTTTSYAIPAGYTTGGTVELTDDILRALEAI